MELLIDENLLKKIKPLGFAALGLGAIVAITYAFNKLNQGTQSQIQDQQKIQSNKIKPAGIYNQGNTCFVNSLLQALAPLKSLVVNFQQLTQQHNEKSDIHQQLIYELKESLNKINKEQGSVQITKFLSVVGSFSQLINLQQQDAYQLFSVIVNSLEHVYNQNKKMSLNRSTLSTNSIDLQQSMINCSQYQQDNEVKNILLGYTRSSILCQACREEANIKIHPFYNLSFDISQNRIRTLQDAINHFQQKQYIEGWVCTRCSLIQHLNKLKAASKQISARKVQHSEHLLKISSEIQKFLKKQPNQSQISEINQQLGGFIKKYQKQYLQIGQKNQYRDQIFVQISPVLKNISKQCVISKFPKVLVIHLKQLSIHPLTGQPILLRKRIDFPNNLIIKVKKGQKKYELVSMVSHSGNQQQGHYFTFRKMRRGQESWFCISDTNSYECKQTFLREFMPYMLFYELVQ